MQHYYSKVEIIPIPYIKNRTKPKYVFELYRSNFNCLGKVFSKFTLVSTNATF